LAAREQERRTDHAQGKKRGRDDPDRNPRSRHQKIQV
jgi:hypothetical protein